MSGTLSIDRYRGAMVGLAVGDALGAPVEGWPPGTFEPVVEMTGGGQHDLQPGQWTDDTAMALCLAESLIECEGFDPVDQLHRYVRWYRDGHRSSTGSAFGSGSATRGAITRFEMTGEPYPGAAEPSGTGNGCLMKLAPVPLAFARDPASAVARAADCARTTHGAPEAIDAARFLARLLVAAIRGGSKEDVLASPGDDLHPAVAEVAAGSYRDRTPPQIRADRHAVGCLEAALWALDTTGDFAEGLVAAVNLGDDADTVAAVYGQLAGALYGIGAIPPRWRSEVAEIDWILVLADALHGLATTRVAAPLPEPLTLLLGR